MFQKGVPRLTPKANILETKVAKPGEQLLIKDSVFIVSIRVLSGKQKPT